jgi:type II secretory pathway component PulJ
MKATSRRRPTPLLQSDNGFTLAELAVGVTVGALLIMITITLLSTLLRTHQRLGGLSRLQERWSRVQFLLDAEIQEAHSLQSITNGLQLISCEPESDANFYESSDRCSNGATPATGSPGYELTPDSATSTFRLQRRGPMIEINGALRRQGTRKSCDDYGPQVVTTGVERFELLEITDQNVQYSLAFRDPLDPNGSTYKKESSARVRIRPL